METFPLLYVQGFATALGWVWQAVMPYLIASFFLRRQLTTKMKSVRISSSSTKTIQAFVNNPNHLSLEVGKVHDSF